jgi:hypothetical protein
MKINAKISYIIHVDSIGFDYFVKKIEFTKTRILGGINFITSHGVRAQKTHLLRACFRIFAFIK